MSLISTKNKHFEPQSQVLLECSLAKISDQYQFCTGQIIPSDRIERKCSIGLTSSPGKTDPNGKISVSAINFSDNRITLINRTEIAHFEVLKGAQVVNLMKFDPQLVSFAEIHNPDDLEANWTSWFKISFFKKLIHH